MDRSKSCPSLLRIFLKIGGHRSTDAFQVRGQEPVDNELQVYAWPDITLKELSDLVKGETPEARARGATLDFRLIYPDKKGRQVMKNLGTVTTGKRGSQDDIPLSSTKYQTGDLLALAIYP